MSGAEDGVLPRPGPGPGIFQANELYAIVFSHSLLDQSRLEFALFLAQGPSVGDRESDGEGESINGTFFFNHNGALGVLARFPTRDTDLFGDLRCVCRLDKWSRRSGRRRAEPAPPLSLPALSERVALVLSKENDPEPVAADEHLNASEAWFQRSIRRLHSEKIIDHVNSKALTHWLQDLAWRHRWSELDVTSSIP